MGVILALLQVLLNKFERKKVENVKSLQTDKQTDRQNVIRRIN